MKEIKLYDRKIYEGCEKAVLQCYVQSPSPELTMPPRPAVIVFPGGGYDYTSDREAQPVANVYLAAGYSAFVLRYAVKDEASYPNPLIDAAAALAYVRSHAEEFYIDPCKVAVCGFSAGGHLAALIGTQWHLPLLREALGGESESFRPDAMILGYPVISGVNTSHLHSFLNLLGKEPTHEQLASLSAELNVDGRTPPAFIWHTADDTCVPVNNSLVFAQALTAAGVVCELHIFPKGPHGLSVCTREAAGRGREECITPYVGKWKELSVRFLENVFSSGRFID